MDEWGDIYVLLTACGYELHKEELDKQKTYYYVTDECDKGRPEENEEYRWMSETELNSFLAELSEKNSGYVLTSDGWEQEW